MAPRRREARRIKPRALATDDGPSESVFAARNDVIVARGGKSIRHHSLTETSRITSRLLVRTSLSKVPGHVKSDERGSRAPVPRRGPWRWREHDGPGGGLGSLRRAFSSGVEGPRGLEAGAPRSRFRWMISWSPLRNHGWRSAASAVRWSFGSTTRSLVIRSSASSETPPPWAELRVEVKIRGLGHIVEDGRVVVAKRRVPAERDESWMMRRTARRRPRRAPPASGSPAPVTPASRVPRPGSGYRRTRAQTQTPPALCSCRRGATRGAESPT